MKILNTNKCSDSLEHIIKDGEHFVAIVSPYIKFTKRIESFLQMADEKGVPIFILTRKLLDKEEYFKINHLNNLVICIHPPLHAKIYFNENEVLISSLNLYDFSQQNNTEIGVKFLREDYIDEFGDISTQLYEILQDKRSDIVIDKLDEDLWDQFYEDLGYEDMGYEDI